MSDDKKEIYSEENIGNLLRLVRLRRNTYLDKTYALIQTTLLEEKLERLSEGIQSNSSFLSKVQR